VLEVERNDTVGGLIHLMRAGNVPTAEYWRRLARINWHDVFYSEDSPGVPFFLELKAKIEKEYAPDYLLIDSRTGITEIGGVATTVLPDVIVCLLLNNRENLDGAREVLRSIRRARRQREQPPIEILPVLARLPASAESSESGVLEAMRDFLNEDAPDIEDNLSFPAGLLVLHTEPRLEVKESLLIESGTSGDSPLFRDYIHLLAKLVPAEVFMRHIGPLVEQAKSGFLDDPQKAEKDLVALCELASVPAPHRALLSLCFATKAEKVRILHVAHRYWSMTGRDDDPLLLRALHDCLGLTLDDPSPLRVPLGFVEAVWRAHGGRDAAVGTLLANAYLRLKQSREACDVIVSLVDRGDLAGPEVVECLRLAVQASNEPLSNDLIARYKGELLGDPSLGDGFWRAWARAVALFGSEQQASEFRNSVGQPGGLDVPALVDYCEALQKSGTIDLRSEMAALLPRVTFGEAGVTVNTRVLGRFMRMVDQLELEPHLHNALSRHMSPEDAYRFIQNYRRAIETGFSRRRAANPYRPA